MARASLHKCLIWGFAVAALGCSLDEREVLRAGGSLSPGDPDATLAMPGVGSGSGVPVLGVEPAAYSFGPAVLGLPARGRVSILNTGNGPLAKPVSTLVSGSDTDYTVLHDQCDNDVLPGERCDVRLQLVATKEGELAARLGVQSSAQAAEAALTGIGVAAGPLSLAPGTGSSGDLGGLLLNATAEAAFDVSNPSPDPSGPLSISMNEGQFRVLPPLTGECQSGATVLASGQGCRVRVAFTPVRRGAVDASLVVGSALGATSTPLSGVGLLAATLAAPEAIDFGGVVLQSVGRRTLRVENAGDQPLELAGVALAGEVSSGAVAAGPQAPVSADAGVAAPAAPAGSQNPFSVQSSDCGAGKVLAGGEHCNVTLAFRPLAAAAGQAQLVISAADGAAHNVGLSGAGLSQGTLQIAPVPGSTASFGALPVGQSQSQQFIVSNQSTQPSGFIELATNDDFVVAPAAAAGDCESGVSSLVNGQSCVVSVIFTPSDRGERDGSLLVTSILAGGAHLPLTGQGRSPGTIELARTDLDFGRVPTDAPVAQQLTVSNDGDELLAALEATIEAPGGGAASAFSLSGGCEALNPGASCLLTLQFLPVAAADYAAVLRLRSPGGQSASALLLGRAFPRGSLVVAPAAGATTDFGDVALGTSRMSSFTLTNPGSVPSGRLALSTSDSAFVVAEGDCNPAGGAGLVNGSSCTFSVTFTPVTSEPLTVSLSVQSPGAGESALSLAGRGRTAASLAATGNRDFGTANVDEDTLTEATQYQWAVTNAGDLDSGVLGVQVDNPVEFIVSNDTCAGASVLGHGTCTLDIRFRPSASGPRSATLTLTDTVSAQVLQLVMTGDGQLVAQPGESCVNAVCAAGVCTAGVCCDRVCNGSCQACSAAGVCQDQDGREPCGNGPGECFGVDRCLLPEAQPCSAADQCGSGSCQRRLGGQNPADQICCLDVCAAGQQCNAQTGRCEVPPLGAGAACGAAGQAACGAGLECKTCLAGGSQCTPPNVCCGGCGAYDCINGECGCSPDAAGRPQIDCGGGQCIPDRELACCAVDPTCPANAPVCDGAAGLCRQCLQAADCPARNDGTFRACTNFSCVYACSTQQGFRDCNGGCISGDQCCADQECGDCGDCVGNTCRGLSDGQTGRCVGGRECLGGTCQFPPAPEPPPQAPPPQAPPPPRVLCDGQLIDIVGGQFCCNTRDTTTAAAIPFETVLNSLADCPRSNLDIGGVMTTPITCDDNTDCDGSDICCLTGVEASAIECMPATQCPGGQSSILCSAPQGDVGVNCPAGTSCQANFLASFSNAWQFCQF